MQGQNDMMSVLLAFMCWYVPATLRGACLACPGGRVCFSQLKGSVAFAKLLDGANYLQLVPFMRCPAPELPMTTMYVSNERTMDALPPVPMSSQMFITLTRLLTRCILQDKMSVSSLCKCAPADAPGT